MLRVFLEARKLEDRRAWAGIIAVGFVDLGFGVKVWGLWAYAVLKRTTRLRGF